MLAEQIDLLYSKLTLSFYRNTAKSQQDNELSSLSTTDVSTLEVVYLLDHPSYKELTDFLGLTTSNANYRISKLIDKGYLQREQDKSDKRRYFLSVTDKFMQYYCVNDDFMVQTEQRAQERLTKKDLDELERLFGILINEIME